MRREDLIILRDKIKNKKVKMYSGSIAYDYINNETIEDNKFFYDFELENTDQSAELACSIVKALERLMGETSFIYSDFETIDFSIIPKLFFDINTISDKLSAVIDNEGVEYEKSHVELKIFFSVVRNGERFIIENYSLEGVVDYNNFYRIMNNFGFNLPYTSMEELSSSIMEAAKGDDLPKFTISLDDDPKKNIK